MHDTHRLSIGLALALVLSASLPATAQQAPSAPSAGAPMAPTAPTAVRVPVERRGALAESAAGAAAAPAHSAFWTAVGDSTLDRLLDQALDGNLDLRAASARVDAAGAARTQAALDLAPVVTANAGYTRRRLASASFPGVGGSALPDQDLWDSGLNGSWELDLFGRVRGSLRARNALLGASDADMRDVRVALAADVAGTYFQLRGAQGQLAVAQRNAENQRKTLELTQARLDAGRGNAFDTERARAQLAATRAAIPALEARMTALQDRLALLLGRAPGEPVVDLAAGGLPDFPDSVPAAIPTELARTRPDVLAAERQLAASRSLTSAARADYLPRISVAASAGYLAGTPGSIGRTGTLNFAVGPVVSWPAFDVGRVKARVDEAQAQELEARARYDQSLLNARAELATASVAYQRSRARLADLRESAAASEHAAALARLRYEGGIADFLQVLDAERTLLGAEDQLAQAQTDVANAYVALARATGADWRVDPAR